MQKINPIAAAMKNLRGGFLAIAIFSFVLNILMLAGPLYMLQVYDRVLTSQNMDTLIALSVLLIGVFLVIGCLELIRLRILNRLGTRFELNTGVPVLEAAMRSKVLGSSQTGNNILADVNAFRDFLSGTTLIAFFDLPWVPMYIVILFVLHPYLGLMGLAGAIILTILALMNSSSSNKPMKNSAVSRQQSDGLFLTCERNAELVQAMGMKTYLTRRWYYFQSMTSQLKATVTDRIATYSTISKTFRMALQSGILGLGAALTVAGESTAGVMIAATIILGRALAPIDQAIGQWRTFLAAMGSYRKIKDLTIKFPEEKQRTKLPFAEAKLTVAISRAGPPLSQTATLSGINFELEAGDVMAVIGPSGSGKSTLAKMLAGIWQPQKGDVLFDGTATSKLDKNDLGRQVGYLPQDVELFDGTLYENISRFSDDHSDEKILKAARDSDVHDLVLDLEDGYETEIGRDGYFLSGGQRQRIGLARALYDDPFIVILDEPNSNLDATGDSALRNAVFSAKERGAIVVVMTHRPAMLQAVNKVLVMNDGCQTAFGLKEEVLRATTKNVIEKKTVKPADDIQVA